MIVTHNMQQAARVSDQCAFFLASHGTPGVIVEHGDTAAMFEQPPGPAHQRLRPRPVRLSAPDAGWSGCATAGRSCSRDWRYAASPTVPHAQPSGVAAAVRQHVEAPRPGTRCPQPDAPAAPTGRARPGSPRTATRAGIPEPAVRAYAAATLRESRDEPGCQLGWTTLAGIGWVESQHGTIGGRTLGERRPLATGRCSGRPSTGEDSRDPRRSRVAPARRPVGATRSGRCSSCPSTWETWAADGDGDGVADPQDLDDAALAAARYLCAARPRPHDRRRLGRRGPRLQPRRRLRATRSTTRRRPTRRGRTPADPSEPRVRRVSVRR